MIYTLTTNPSLDYLVKVSELKIAHINRSKDEKIYPGGKGINTAIVLHNLGIAETALGFIAGFTGLEIKNSLVSLGVNSDFIEVPNGLSRINIKISEEILDDRIEETEINGQGPEISEKEIAMLYQKLESLSCNDFFVISGSIPPSLPKTFYRDVIEKITRKGAKIVVDTTGELLRNTLCYKPFLVKPNIHELSDFFSCKIRSEKEVIFYAKEMQKLGAKNVLVSLGKDGAVLVSEENIVYTSFAPNGKTVNSVGAGDSMVAGFLYGFTEKSSFDEALKMGIASGTASAYSSWLASKEKILEIRKMI